MKNIGMIVILMYTLSMFFGGIDSVVKASELPKSKPPEIIQQFESYTNKMMNYYRQDQYLNAVLTSREMLINVYGYDDKDDSYFESLTNTSYQGIKEYVEYLIEYLNANKSRFLLGYEEDTQFQAKLNESIWAGLINLLQIIQASCAEKDGDYAEALAGFVKVKNYLSYWLGKATPSTKFLTTDGETFREVEIPGAFDSPEVLQQLQESEKWIDEQIVRVANKLGVEPKLYLGEEEDQSEEQDDEQIPKITVDWPQAEEASNDNN